MSRNSGHPKFTDDSLHQLAKANLIQESEEKKLKIIGQIMLDRMESDQELNAWFEQEIDKRLIKKQERELFGLE